VLRWLTERGSIWTQFDSALRLFRSYRHLIQDVCEQFRV